MFLFHFISAVFYKPPQHEITVINLLYKIPNEQTWKGEDRDKVHRVEKAV